MKKLMVLFALTVFGMGNSYKLIGQDAVRCDTVINKGPADTLGLTHIMQNSTNSLIVTGNGAINATQCNFQIACFDSTGTQTWSQMYNNNILKAYSTAATIDNSNNIIVVGSQYVDPTHLQDLVVLKYSTVGALLWSYYYDGGGNDVATDVITDISGNIYVTGSKGGTGFNVSDYVTFALDAFGNPIFTPVTYDYASLVDIPMGIAFNGTTNVITVSGTSGSSFNNYAIATVQYNAVNGATVAADRDTSNTAAYNTEADMLSDASGNVYYTGRVWNGTNFDVQVVKYDQYLTQLWAVSFDGHGLDDAGTKIQLDNSGNVLVTGYVRRTGGGAKRSYCA